MKRITITLMMCFAFIMSFAQDDRIYGGKPTSNQNMSWENDVTPNEKYVGIIQVDSSITPSMIIEAFASTFQTLQDANIMSNQMRRNNSAGLFLSTGSKSAVDFTKAGAADHRMQYAGQTYWNVQFIDGVRFSRFYYNVSVQAKNGKYRLIITPTGLSGYANDHIQTEWAQMFRDGQVKSIYSSYYDQMKIKIAYTIDQWINEVDKYLKSSEW